MSQWVDNLEPVQDGGQCVAHICWDPEDGPIGDGPYEPQEPSYELVDVEGVQTPMQLDQELREPYSHWFVGGVRSGRQQRMYERLYREAERFGPYYTFGRDWGQ